MYHLLRHACAALLPLLFLACDGSGHTHPGEPHADPAVQTATHDHDSPEVAQPKALSPHTTAMGNIGDTHVHVDYSAPGVRGRTIWGGLVAYDRVWATGAHNATAITFDKDVRIGGERVSAGTYAFFTIPGREEWTLILNKNYDQHLADDYDEQLDVLRLTVSPEEIDQPVESLTYAVLPASGDGGALVMTWDRLRITLPIQPI